MLWRQDGAGWAHAELMELDLLTSDRRLAEAPGIRCRVEVL
jgi:predicted nucleic acid-binding protein